MATETLAVRFGKRVRDLRRERGWSQVYLGVHSGLSKTFICNPERGCKEPCLGTIQTLADSFGVSLGEFFRAL
jgi:transcriptional regulator with XRE-family HTH domain